MGPIMVQGFNHNIMYKGESFHVQTEDSGVTTPHIITHLYKGGVILGSKKTGYADIIKIENLASVVEELMKDQHKEMMRRLKSGEFDQRAFPEPPSPVELTGEISSSSPTDAGSDDWSRPDHGNGAAEDVIGLDAAILSIFGADEK
jgi:hypothetical protein